MVNVDAVHCMNGTFPSLLHAIESWLDDEPAREAMVFNNERITYVELASRALSLAATLREHGVNRTDMVAVLATPRPEAIVSLLAVWLVGATWVGVNTRYRLNEQRQILADCGAKVLLAVTRCENRDMTPDLDAHKREGVYALAMGPGLWEGEVPEGVAEHTVVSAWGEALSEFDPKTPALVIYTSGSTGQPKGALISHAGLTFRSQTMWKNRFYGESIRLLLDLPVNHIGALASEIGVAVVSGGLMVASEKFDPGFTLKTIEQEQLTAVFGVPAMITRIVEHPQFKSTDLSSLKFLCWGAGSISDDVLERLMQASEATFTQQYGMTESNGPIVYTPPTRDVDILKNTTGKPDSLLELRIADERDEVVDPGGEGEVQVKMPFPFMGYLNNPRASAATFTADGFLRTGDIAKLRPDGYLVFCGRSKEMFKSGGFNVYPREVEIALEAHPQIRAAAVLAKDDRAWGQVGVAFVESDHELDTASILNWCKARLADFKVPKAIHGTTALPRTPIDKVDKVALGERLKERPKAG